MSGSLVGGKDGAFLRNASRLPIENYFVNRPEATRAKKWINKNNRYRLFCTSRFEEDTIETPPTVNSGHLSDYVGASMPGHVIDGWSYLARAVEAALRGDSYAASHLGYYAELRAAMGLLAGEGVGIFSKWHATIDAKGVVEPFPFHAHANKKNRRRLGTHQVIWPILHHWSGLQKAADLLDELVRPNTMTLSQWLSGLGAAVPVRAVAKQWLRHWGLDLAALDDDHGLRNLASYRPSEFRKASSLKVDVVTDFVEQLWLLFEPSAGRRFPNIERVLLRKAWRQSGGAALTKNTILQFGINDAEADGWVEFLDRPQADDPLPIRLASESGEIENPYCHLRIIARAALLLFVSTSAARRILVNASYKASDVAFWWQRQGEERGLWAANAMLDPLDLWADIAVAINDSKQWKTATPVADQSLHSWRRAQPGALDGLGGLELVGIWGLLP